MGEQGKRIAEAVELGESVDEGGKREQVGVRNRVEDEFGFEEAEAVGVEGEELGGEIGVIGETCLEDLGVGLLGL